MFEVIPAGDKRIYISNLGSSEGNFSSRLDPQRAPMSLKKLISLHGSRSSELIVPSGDYEVYESTQKVGVNAAKACAALVTDRTSHNIILTPADCIPIVIWALGGAAVALIHGGRRELDRGIIHKTVALMCEAYNLKPEELGAYLGPGIREESYILPAEVLATLEHPDWPKHTVRLPGEQIGLDTFGFAREQLVDVGIHDENILDCGINTATDAEFYSHYRSTRPNQPSGPGPGRNGASVVMMAAPGDI